MVAPAPRRQVILFLPRHSQGTLIEYSLRRAFVMAGTKALVMSLWKIPDQQTQELMEDFYRRVLKDQPAKSLVEALRDAQLEIKKKYPHPFFWGAFIYQGDSFAPS
jgi:CHAT domain-containing protein